MKPLNPQFSVFCSLISVPHIQASDLLDGFSRLMHFLLEEETNCICGVPYHARSSARTNYRYGYRICTFRTPIGEFPLSVPIMKLRCLHVRGCMVKRAKRLASDVLESLARIHTTGTTRAHATALIEALWVLELPDDLLARLARKLIFVLEKWRRGEPVAATALFSPANINDKAPCQDTRTSSSPDIPNKQLETEKHQAAEEMI